MARSSSRKTFPATEAAVRAGISRERVIRLIQAGDLKGRRDERGRWVVDAISLQRWSKRKAEKAKEARHG